VDSVLVLAAEKDSIRSWVVLASWRILGYHKRRARRDTSQVLPWNGKISPLKWAAFGFRDSDHISCMGIDLCKNMVI
jgi:hypothetical protein